MAFIIHAPLINVNDEEMVLLEWLKPAGAKVRVGEAIAVVETTKSTAELEADESGYLRQFVEPGAEITVGQMIGAILEAQDEPFEFENPKIENKKSVDIRSESIESETGSSRTPDIAPFDYAAERRSAQGMPRTSHTTPRTLQSSPGIQGTTPGTPKYRWTRKAEILLRRKGLDISTLDLVPADGEVIRESDILGLASLGPAGLERVLVIGGGGAGVQILDVLSRVENQAAVGVLDDDPNLAGKQVLGKPVLGSISQAPRLLEAGEFDAAVISIGTSVDLRAGIFERLAGWGVPFTNVVDPRAVVLSDVEMGQGNAVMALAQIAAGTRIGDNNFISSFVDLEHHNELGSHCTFGPGVMTSGGVRIGSRVKFGAGVFVEPLLSIGSGSVVASGVVLTRSVPENAIVKTRTNFVVRKRDV